ncbi:MAG: divalent-cation tolerance protein CutA [Candidatus Nanohaloarchaeota archaeon QJJ-7]|nr:divalent-cation tolerance protein CutA [Candidatus Nanohaloarchaeota archaeon QJJ-7]
MKLYYVTFPDRSEMERITGNLIEEDIAACVNSFPVGSVYTWEGEKKREGEVAAFLKTSDGMSEELVEKLEDEHPYDVPEILEIGVEANESYEGWVEDETE